MSRTVKQEKPRLETVGYADLGSQDTEVKASRTTPNATTTRRNRSSTIHRLDRFKNIDDGVIPFRRNNNTYTNTSNLDVSDTIILCQKAYYNISIFRNTIDLMSEFSSDDIYLTGGSKKAKNFFEAWLKKINIWDLQDQFFREYYRSGNVVLFRYDTKIKDSDIFKIAQTFGLAKASNMKIPSKYVILNPAEIKAGENISFENGRFYKELTDYEIHVLANQETQESKDVLDSLDPEVRKKILKYKGTTKGAKEVINVELPPEKIKAVFYKKQDYEPMAIPMGYPVLEDINWKLELKKMDMAITRTVQQAVLLITVGNEENGVDQKQVNQLQELFKNESVGRVLVSDYTTKASFVIPEIANILDPKKYEIVDRDIKLGLNNIILGEEKFSSTTTKAQIFIERLTQARESFLNNFLIPEFKRIAKELGFKNYPTPKFVEISLTANVNQSRVITRLVELGILTNTEGVQAIQTGRFPSEEESIENQKKYKELRNKGLYEPLIGGGGKGDQKGRPDGTPEGGRDKAGQNASPAGGGESSASSINYSLTTFAEKFKNSIASEKLVEKLYKSTKKIKRLNDTHRFNIESIASIVFANEDSDNWLDEDLIKSYISEPFDKNNEKVMKVNEVAAHHQIDPKMAAILIESEIKEEEK